MTNQFALYLSECHASTGKFDIDAAVWIDGRVVDQPYYINLPELTRSIHAPGDYEIFVCGCGSAGCAGTTAVGVSHDGDIFRWELDLPICDWAQEGDHEALFPTTQVAFAFEREQMIDAMASFVAAARDLIGTNVD